ncbi:peptidylprolyl isomerase [Candidatus Marinamargulisbacteria bacterium SCGC AG-410-N11]|nr:peptidylprolyl isomerase [Candidatus Marinamargulisbacteria bacterium SCGC AG-410-N11]
MNYLKVNLLFFIVFLLFFNFSIFSVDDNPLVRIITNKGDIIVKLYPEKVPSTCQHFLNLVQHGIYNDTIIHRVIDGFIIQGGGFYSNFKAVPNVSPIKNESNRGLQNERGTIGFSQTIDYNSASTQFYINLSNNSFLNFNIHSQKGFTAFGKIINGMNVVDKIQKINTEKKRFFSINTEKEETLRDVPIIPVKIIRMTILKSYTK